MDNTDDVVGTLDADTNDGNSNQQSADKSGTTKKDWEASYKGLQTLYNKLKRSHDELEAKYAQAVQSSEEVTLKASDKDKSLKTLNDELTSLREQVKTLEGEKFKSDSKAARAQLIMAKYPELSEFEADGLLPNADTPEELETAFEKFREKLSKQSLRVEKEKTKGAPPDDTDMSDKGTGTAESEDYVWDQLMKSAGSNPAEYAKWQAKWDEIQAAKDKR
jgi:chromosome segregation ATPase